MRRRKNEIGLDQQVGAVASALGSKLSLLQTRSDFALDTFRSTLKELDDVNAEIDNAVTLADEHMKSISEKRESLLANRAANVKVGDKIRDFLGL